MEKVIKIIVVSALVLLCAFELGFSVYNAFLPDDSGKEYEQVWVSKDNNISFIRDNKKGFDGQNCEYRADYKNNNPEYSTDCTISFSNMFELRIYADLILLGKSDFNSITQTMKVTIEDVNPDSPYKLPYKAGDVIEFIKQEQLK